MKIEITAADIEGGARWSRFASPVALALQRQFPGQHVEVTASRAYVGEHTCRLPLAAQEFLADFGFGRTVQPFSFEVDFVGAPR